MPFQMALDELLFRQMEENPQPPILRFYYSGGPAVTVGYSHRHPRESEDQQPLGDSRVRGNDRKPPLPVVQRITGGGRVVHGEDLIFSLIARKEHDESFRSVRVSYWKIHEALKKGFETLGLGVRFYRCDENLPEGPDCFRFPIASDLALGKEKIAGGAQKRSAGTLLHQESVALCGRKSEDLIRAFVKGFETIFGTQVQSVPLDPEWFEKAKALAENKYQAMSPLSF